MEDNKQLVNFEKLAVQTLHSLIEEELLKVEDYTYNNHNTLYITLGDETLEVEVEYYARCIYEGRLQTNDTPPEPAEYKADVTAIKCRVGDIIYIVDEAKYLKSLQGIELQ